VGSFGFGEGVGQPSAHGGVHRQLSGLAGIEPAVAVSV
jgi:hypothetical protein